MLKPAALAAALVLALAAPASADKAPELSGTAWVNSKELSLERLRGKVVVLLFFEES